MESGNRQRSPLELKWIFYRNIPHGAWKPGGANGAGDALTDIGADKGPCGRNIGDDSTFRNRNHHDNHPVLLLAAFFRPRRHGSHPLPNIISGHGNWQCAGTFGIRLRRRRIRLNARLRRQGFIGNRRRRSFDRFAGYIRGRRCFRFEVRKGRCRIGRCQRLRNHFRRCLRIGCGFLSRRNRDIRGRRRRFGR